MPVRTVVAIWPLFAGLSLIGLAVGVQGSLLGVRAALEGFDDLLIGLLMSCYFAGFLAGSLLTPRMIQRVACVICKPLGMGANEIAHWLCIFNHLCRLRKLAQSILQQC